MINFFQAVIMGLLQGISELFPVSSLGHSVIFPSLFGWNLNQNDPFFLMFLVATHLATAIVLFIFFWGDWKRILTGMGRSLAQRNITAANPYGRLGWLLVVGTIPAGIIGLLLQDKLQAIFAAPKIAAFFLIANGGLLYLGECLRKKAPRDLPTTADTRLGIMSWTQALKVGAMQVLALIPGLSRSGSTMVGGLWQGLSNEDAARFSFLLATPIIGGAALVKIPELLITKNPTAIAVAGLGALCAALAAYLAVKFLMRYFHNKTLTPFALYCAAAGIIFSLILYFR
jgi:undecaprenyl-diphosphatase